MTPTPHEDTITQLVGEGQTQAALDYIANSLIVTPDAALHLARLRLLAPDLKQIAAIGESLDWLKMRGAETQDGEQFDHARRLVDVGLQNRLTRLRHMLHSTSLFDNKPNDMLDELNRLAPLAKYYPMISLTRGLVYIMNAERRARSNGSGRSAFDMLGNLLASSDFKERRKNRVEPLPNTARDLYLNAVADLEAAVIAFNAEDPLRGEALMALGQTHEVTGNPLEAWKAYRSAQDYGYEIEEQLDQLRDQIRSTAQSQFLKHIDALLSHNRLDEAADLLERCSALGEGDQHPFQIRRADLALLRGDTETALALYAQFLETYVS